MTLEEFNILKEKISNFLEINDSNISRKLLDWAKFYSKVLDRFVTESKLLSDDKVQLDEIHAKYFKKYKEDYNRDLKASEIEIYINSEKEYSDKKIAVNQQQMFVDYLENFLTILKNMQFNMKSFVDLKTFLGGK